MGNRDVGDYALNYGDYFFKLFFSLVTVTLKGIKLGPCGQAAAMLSKSWGVFPMAIIPGQAYYYYYYYYSLRVLDSL